MQRKQHLAKVPFYLLIVMLIMGAVNYIVQPDMVKGWYSDLGFPVWVYYFNLTAKILGVIALLLPQVPQKIKDYAWAGILYLLLLALIAHLMIGDGQYIGAAIGLVLWAVASWMMWKKK